MNINLLWMCLLPFALSIATVFVVRGASTSDKQQMWMVSGGAFVVSIALICAAFFMAKSAKTSDVEVWNGQITNKERVHDHYLRSYQCRCRTVTSGSGNNKTTSTQCDTCYEDRYTVTWTANSTIGDFRIEHFDRGSKSVYSEPDPLFFTRIQQGDPCSRLNSYTNYIKAVPESLFRPSSEAVREKFADQVPSYPASIFDYYKINRVLAVGVKIPDLAEWNREVSMALRTIGTTKQANFVIVVVNTADPDYFYALQDAWVGAKKNDIVVVIGAPDFPSKASWVGVMAMTDKELFKVQLRDDLMDLPSLTAKAVVDTMVSNTNKTYQRKSMKDFQYLDAEIDPPTWVIALVIALVISIYLGIAYYFRTQISQPTRRYRF